MSHVFEGQPDERQSREFIHVSRFRPRYRALTDEEKAIHDKIKSAASDMEQIFNEVKDGRYKSLAITSLEEAVMWIVKGLTESL